MHPIVIRTDEMLAIMEDASVWYIEKYGVDPANPKVDVVDGFPLPKEEVERLVKSGKIKDLGDAEPLAGTRGGPSEGPHAINGEIWAHIFIAEDDRHEPTGYIGIPTYDALSRFDTEFGVDMKLHWYINFWNASDVNPADNTSAALNDLHDDVSWVREADNDIVIGWLHDMDHNGMAYSDGMWDLNEDGVIDFAPYCVCSDTASGVDWPHDSIVQHEVSHLFDVRDQGRWWWEHPECIMNYWYAYRGTNVWCDNCSATVDENIGGY